MPDVSSTAPEEVRLWMALDVHKHSIVAATLPPTGGTPELQRIENTERAIRRFIDRLGGPEGLAVCYEAGPGGFELLRLLTRLGVACDVIAPSLVPVRAGDRVKTDHRDAKKLVRLYRAGELTFVQPPTPQKEGLRDLVRCRDDLRCARTRGAPSHRQGAAAPRPHLPRRQEVLDAQAPRVGARQRLDDPLAQRALEHMLAHLDGLDAQLAAIDARARADRRREPWADAVAWLYCFRGISTRTALGLLAEIGDFRRFAHGARADELPRPDPQRVLLRRPAAPRPHHQEPATTTPAGCWSKPPGTTATTPPPTRQPHADPPSAPAPGRPRSACTTATEHLTNTASARLSTNVAIARELTGFLWAAMTHQPLPTRRRRRLTPDLLGPGGRRDPPEDPRLFYAIPTRDPSARQLTTGHCPAVPTRASQSDQSSLPSRPAARPQHPPP